MDNWDEIRTAFQVAKMGTVSGAADVLGVHHATVIRHIDALEGNLGVRLFQRHARGYTPTEAGKDLMRVAQTTDEQFSQLSSRVKGQGSEVSGELVITSLSGLSQLLMPVLSAFQEEHPEIVLRYLTGDRLFRLEYGEAHVAIRAGRVPQEPDNVVQPLFAARTGLYATRAYIERMGMPSGPADFAQHHFVGYDDRDTRAPFFKWLWDNIPDQNIVFRTLDTHALVMAVRAGAGLGFVQNWQAKQYDDLVEIDTGGETWESPFWLVTHVDLHRTTKVQAFLKHLKDHAGGWS